MIDGLVTPHNMVMVVRRERRIRTEQERLQTVQPLLQSQLPQDLGATLNSTTVATTNQSTSGGDDHVSDNYLQEI